MNEFMLLLVHFFVLPPPLSTAPWYFEVCNPGQRHFHSSLLHIQFYFSYMSNIIWYLIFTLWLISLKISSIFDQIWMAHTAIFFLKTFYYVYISQLFHTLSCHCTLVLSIKVYGSLFLLPIFSIGYFNLLFLSEWSWK